MDDQTDLTRFDLTPLQPARPRSVFEPFRKRVLSGALVVLPIVVTVWLTGLIYNTLRNLVLDPVAEFVAARGIGTEIRDDLPGWWQYVVAPLLGTLIILLILYFLGLVVRSRLQSVIDWFFSKVPGVSHIYQAVRGATKSLEGPGGPGSQFQRVVLVTFPHPGLRSVGLVTKTLKDRATGRKILSVAVLTGVVPPTGFTLLVPETDVTETDWSVNDALQFILTGGLTSPANVPYFDPAKANAASK